MITSVQNFLQCWKTALSLEDNCKTKLVENGKRPFVFQSTSQYYRRHKAFRGNDVHLPRALNITNFPNVYCLPVS